MRFSNEPVDAVLIIEMLIPVVTFAMGYFFSDIGRRREMKRLVLKEKFEKLYHPFFLMVLDIDGGDPHSGSTLALTDKAAKQVIDFLLRNIYLASAKAQNQYYATASAHYKILALKDAGKGEIDPGLRGQLDAGFAKLLGLMLNEYKELAFKLGYEFVGDINVS